MSETMLNHTRGLLSAYHYKLARKGPTITCIECIGSVPDRDSAVKSI